MAENIDKKAKLDKDWEKDKNKKEKESLIREETDDREIFPEETFLSQESFFSKNRRKLIFLLGIWSSLALVWIPLFHLLSNSPEKSKKSTKKSKVDLETLKFQNQRYFDLLMDLRNKFKGLKNVIEQKESLILSELEWKNFKKERKKISQEFEKLERICIDIDSKLIFLWEDVLLNRRKFNTTFIDISYIKDTLNFIKDFDIEIFLESYSFEEKPFKTVEFLVSEFYKRMEDTYDYLSDIRSKIKIA